LPGDLLQSLAEAAQHFGQASIQWPIQLTPKAPFHLGVAALVFLSPHLLSPADDAAEFGIRSVAPSPWEDLDPPALSESTHLPPYDGAQVVAWFRPLELNREYNVEFNCQGVTGHNFVLGQRDGGQETAKATDASQAGGIGLLSLSTNIQAGERDWLTFGMSSDAYWRFVSCEISMLPA
jgi:hypothetical protein